MVQFDVTEGRFSAREASPYPAPNETRGMGEKVVELADDPGRREEMGRCGRMRVVEELNWQHQIDPLLAASRQALED